MTKTRGFEEVSEKMRKNQNVLTDEKGKKVLLPIEVKLPTRADLGSSGYDFYLPKDVVINPGRTELIHTDVKAYMKEDEELLIFIRSSLAIKQGLELANKVGKIDSSYYNNENNEGNIIIALKNTTGKTVTLTAGDRIAQGTFYKYLTIDDDLVLSQTRIGGVGSSGK